MTVQMVMVGVRVFNHLHRSISRRLGLLHTDSQPYPAQTEQAARVKVQIGNLAHRQLKDSCCHQCNRHSLIQRQTRLI